MESSFMLYRPTPRTDEMISPLRDWERKQY